MTDYAFPGVDGWLAEFVRRHDGAAGSVHVVRAGDLHLAATVNIPEIVRAAVEIVPRGKGMAGLAWERAVPVQTCNLQEDSAEVKPGAKAVDAAAAVAIPVQMDSGAVVAVVGIAFAEAGELPDERVDALSADASGVRTVVIET